MPIAKQADSDGGGVAVDMSCISVTAGTNTEFPVATDVTPCGVCVVLQTMINAAEITSDVTAAMDSQRRVFIGISLREFNGT
jgi:hypothetical protein